MPAVIAGTPVFTAGATDGGGNFTVTLPTGVAGDRFALFITNNPGTTGRTATFPVGWDKDIDVVQGNIGLAYAELAAAGGETTVVVTLSGQADAVVAWATRITGHGTEAEYISAVSALGDVDIGLLTVPWGVASNLYLVADACEVGFGSIAAPPSGYAGITSTGQDAAGYKKQGNGAGAVALMVAQKTATGSTENPGAFDSADASSVGIILGVEPSGGGAPTVGAGLVASRLLQRVRLVR